MPSQSIARNQFESITNSHDVIFVDFWAAWCAPCKQFSRVYELVSQQFSSILFAKVNIEEQQELADFFEIRSIPHLMVFKHGVVIYSDAGTIAESTLKDLAQQALDTDVSAIRAQMNAPQE
jgi:thioredoxin 1